MSLEPRTPFSGATRRGFLERTAALSAVAAAVPSLSASGAGRVIGANDRIRIGCIGVGGNGTGMLRNLVAQSGETKDIEVLAVCDVYALRKQRAKEIARLADKDVHHDYRELLARNDIDAVFISVPDHWHAPMALDAMAAGKDVYLQKPMTLTVEEAREVSAAALKHGRVLQVGSQHLSDLRYHRAKELIAEGLLGDLLWAQATYSRNSIDGEWNYYVDEEGTPENIDWKRWLGPAPKRPFSAERYFRWRKYWDYSGGIATDLFYHRLGPLLYAMGPRFPTRVVASGGIYVQKDREVPDTYATVIEYPDFYVNLSSSMANAAAGRYFPEVIYGHKATLVFQGSRIVVAPEGALLDGSAPEDVKKEKVFEVERNNMVRGHTDNFFASMRSRKQPILGPELGYQIMTAIKLGVDSYRQGRAMLWDARAQREGKKMEARASFEGDGKNRPQGRKKRA